MVAAPHEFAVSQADDREILDAWREGNGALELLYRRYADRLRQFCRGKLGDAAEAEDACHESILKANAALDRFNEGAGIWPWLSTIAAHVCIDINRHRSHSVLRERMESASEDFEQVLESRARAEMVDQALANLRGYQKALIYLREFQGLSYDQIAQTMGTSVASVRSTLLRARRALKESVHKAARERGLWPLPAVLPIGIQRIRSTFRRWISALSRDLVEEVSQLVKALDVAMVAGLINAVAILAIGVLPSGAPSTHAVDGSADSAVLSRTTSEVGDDALGRPNQTIKGPASRPGGKAYEVGSSSNSADVNDDGEEDGRIKIGPVKISCDPSEPQGLIKDTVCLLLGARSSDQP